MVPALGRSLTPLRALFPSCHRYSYHHARVMSTESTEYLFAVWAPDYPDALPRRLEVRPRHFEEIKAYMEDGTLIVGGAMVDEASLPSSVTAKNMEGSVMIFRAASLEDVKSIVEKDIYWTGNVWDKEKLQIKPFHAAKQ